MVEEGNKKHNWRKILCLQKVNASSTDVNQRKIKSLHEQILSYLVVLFRPPGAASTPDAVAVIHAKSHCTTQVLAK